jgi:hypothetical protein
VEFLERMDKEALEKEIFSGMEILFLYTVLQK